MLNTPKAADRSVSVGDMRIDPDKRWARPEVRGQERVLQVLALDAGKAKCVDPYNDRITWVKVSSLMNWKVKK